MRTRALVASSVLVAAAAAGWLAIPAGPHAEATAATVVQEVHPATREVPANLLRLYVVFSASMSIGEARDRVRLVEADGRRVDRAFLELQEELWDPTRRRLTLLFDPGRIKRGLRGHEELGAPLQPGHRYRLEIDGAWRDGRGRPLGAGFSHELVAGPDDRESPDPSSWRLDPPGGATAPLAVRFPEPLDRALLSSRMAVEDAAGRRVAGTIDVDEGDRRWRFTPTEAWRGGTYRLRVAPDLEDVAGNSLRRLFDADLTRDRAPSAGGDEAWIARPFLVAGS
jgi:Bacterial Ig-like domain